MKKRIVTALALLVMTSSATMADTLKGVVKDKNTGEPLIGATVMVGDRGIATDINGHFSLTGLKRGKHTIIILKSATIIQYTIKGRFMSR